MTDYLLDPDTLQFELTSMCNALCLGCPRTDDTNFNRPKPSIPKKSIMSLSTFSSILDSETSKKVRKIEFCGTIDEPLMHPEFFKILDIVYEKRPDFKISIHTNGSLRSESEWKQLAISLNRFKSYSIWFGIDGLEDTHHLYRQYTDFNKIIKNAQAFIDAGGRAGWQLLIFPWNKHQVETARQLAEKMGFEKFKTRNDRSRSHELSFAEIAKRKKENKTQTATFNDENNFLEYNGYQIDCIWQKDKMFFISHDNRLWPCCFFANERYSNKQRRDNLESRLYDNYGEDFNNLTKFTMDEILNHRFFKSQLTTSWKNNIGTGETDKIGRCAYTCSKRGLKENPIYQHSEFELSSGKK